MSKESQPHRTDHLRKTQAIGLKAAGIIMIPLGVYGIYHGSQIDGPIKHQEATEQHAETSVKTQEKPKADANNSKSEAVVFALGGLATAMGGFGALMEGIVKGREKDEDKGYIHHVHPWKAYNAYATSEPLTNDQKREVTLPYRKTRFIK